MCFFLWHWVTKALWVGFDTYNVLITADLKCLSHFGHFLCMMQSYGWHLMLWWGWKEVRSVVNLMLVMSVLTWVLMAPSFTWIPHTMNSFEGNPSIQRRNAQQTLAWFVQQAKPNLECVNMGSQRGAHELLCSSPVLFTATLSWALLSMLFELRLIRLSPCSPRAVQ